MEGKCLQTIKIEYEFVLPNINMYYKAMQIKAMWNVVWVQKWKNTVRKECLKTSPPPNRKA